VNSKEILKDIGARTNGDVYLGVVGPVRTGKSTFIKRFMEIAVVPNIQDEYLKGRTIDELPQSGEGKTIMTTEPKFIPSSAATVQVDEEISVKVRLVDCVGYVIPSAKGYKDDEGVRMVKTPWLEEAIPFDEAAKIGTQKVIQEHSSIGVVVTSDGTITEIDRIDYKDAEEQVIKELKDIGKPFIILVNSKDPSSSKCLQVVDELKNKFDVPAIGLNIDKMNQDDVNCVLKEALYEFPVAKVDLSLPLWVTKLNETHWLKLSIKTTVEESIGSARKIREIQTLGEKIKTNEYISSFEFSTINMETGYVNATIDIKDGLYNDILKELTGFDVDDKAELLNLIQDYKNIKDEFETLRPALAMAKQTGYGYTSIDMKDLEVDKPTLSKQGNRYGIKIDAKVPSWHIIKVDVDTTFEPIMGNKEQAEFLLNSLLASYDESKEALLASQLFGRQVGDVLKDGVSMKLMMMPDANKIRLQNIVKTLANKGKGTLIAFII